MSVSLEQMQEDLRRAHAAGDTELARKIVQRMDQEKAAAPPPPQDQEFDWDKLKPVNWYKRAQQGAVDLIQDPGLTASKMFGDEEEQQKALEFEQQREDRMAELNRKAGNEGMDLARLGGSVAGGGAGPSVGAGGNFLARAGNLAATGGVMGAGAPAGPIGTEGAEGMTPEQIQEQSLKDLGMNVGMGAGAGVILPEMMRLGLNVGTGTVRYIQDLISAADEEGAGAVRYAKEHLLDLMPDDVSRNKLSKTIGQYFDMIDPRSTRQRQINTARRHVEGIQDRNIMDPNTDPQDLISRSMDERAQTLSATDNMNYESVYELTDTLPNGQPRLIDDGGIRNVAEHMFYELQHGIPEIQGTKLENIAARLADGEQKTFRQWDAIRSDLFNQAEMRQMAGDYKSAGILKAMSKRIFTQLDDVAEGLGGDVNKRWQKARRFHEDQVIPNRQGAVGKAVRQRDAEAFVAELIGGGATRDRQSRTHQLWNALDDDGRKAAKQTLIDEVMRAGTDKTQDTGFSPAKAATSLEGLQNRIDGFFNEDEAAQMRGLSNYLRFISRSTMMAGSSGTGMSLGAGLMGGMGYGAATSEEGFPMGAVGAGVGTYFLMRSPRGRALLQKMATTPPDERAFQNLAQDMDSVFEKIAREAGIVAPRASGGGGGW